MTEEARLRLKPANMISTLMNTASLNDRRSSFEGRNYFICRSPLLIDFARLRARTLIIK
jgi:hypothetical protein